MANRQDTEQRRQREKKLLTTKLNGLKQELVNRYEIDLTDLIAKFNQSLINIGIDYTVTLDEFLNTFSDEFQESLAILLMLPGIAAVEATSEQADPYKTITRLQHQIQELAIAAEQLDERNDLLEVFTHILEATDFIVTARQSLPRVKKPNELDISSIRFPESLLDFTEKHFQAIVSVLPPSVITALCREKNFRKYPKIISHYTENLRNKLTITTTIASKQAELVQTDDSALKVIYNQLISKLTQLQKINATLFARMHAQTSEQFEQLKLKVYAKTSDITGGHWKLAIMMLKPPVLADLAATDFADYPAILDRHFAVLSQFQRSIEAQVERQQSSKKTWSSTFGYYTQLATYGGIGGLYAHFLAEQCDIDPKRAVKIGRNLGHAFSMLTIMLPSLGLTIATSGGLRTFGGYVFDGGIGSLKYPTAIALTDLLSSLKKPQFDEQTKTVKSSGELPISKRHLAQLFMMTFYASWGYYKGDYKQFYSFCGAIGFSKAITWLGSKLTPKITTNPKTAGEAALTLTVRLFASIIGGQLAEGGLDIYREMLMRRGFEAKAYEVFTQADLSINEINYPQPNLIVKHLTAFINSFRPSKMWQSFCQTLIFWRANEDENCKANVFYTDTEGNSGEHECYLIDLSSVEKFFAICEPVEKKTDLYIPGVGSPPALT